MTAAVVLVLCCLVPVALVPGQRPVMRAGKPLHLSRRVTP